MNTTFTSSTGVANRPRRGLTLPDLATAMALALAIAAIMMTLLQQQVSFHRIIRAQSFLVEEAPQINNSITQIMSRADAFRLHANLSDAVSDSNAVTTGGKILVVGFLNPDGSREFGLVAFETIDGDSQLGYYRVDSSGSLTNSGDPDWLISRSVANADFFVENGVFRFQLTGPAGERITYSGTPRH
jgi:hypothetical protein